MVGSSAGATRLHKGVESTHVPILILEILVVIIKPFNEDLVAQGKKKR